MRRPFVASLAAAAVVSCAAERPAPRVGSHLTWQALPSETITRIAFGSCAFQWDEQPIWDAVIESAPDLFLYIGDAYIGDAIYGDFDGRQVYDVTRASLNREWSALASVESFQRLADKVPVMAEMLGNMDDDLRDGALGIASTTGYMANGITTLELFNVQRATANYGRFYASHVRLLGNTAPPAEAQLGAFEQIANGVVLKQPLILSHNNNYGWPASTESH